MTPPRRIRRNRSSFRLEALEGRWLLAFGTFPQLDGQAAAAADYPSYTGAGQTIAVLDTGVDYNHPALGGAWGAKVIAGYDFVDGDPDPMDIDGHGTGVAAIAVAAPFTYQGAQYQGLAPGARIVALRTDDGGNDDALTEDRIRQALDWVITNRTTYHITVVNISTGFGHYATDSSQPPFGAELAELAGDGVFIVAASGNDGVINPPGVEYPGADPNVFAAGSINSSDAISTFTERGPNLDILAPGENVPTAYLSNTVQPIYVAATGTSFSAPAIAGAAAVLRQVDPTLTPSQIMQILQSTGSNKFDAPTGLTFTRFNLDAAIREAVLDSGGGSMGGGGSSAPFVSFHGRDNKIAYDGNGNLHEVWLDASDGHLKYAERTSAKVWSNTQIVESSGDFVNYPTLAVDSNGSPEIAYYDAQHGVLKYATPDGAGGWKVIIADSTSRAGYYPSLLATANGPVITYYFKRAGDLRMAAWSGSGFSISTIDSNGDVGRSSSLARLASGTLIVAYEESGHGWVKYASQVRSGWSTMVVDATTQGTSYISLTPSASGRPAFSYYDAYNANLKYARYDGKSWATTTIVSRGSVGSYSNLLFDANGNVDVFFYNRSNDSLMRAKGDIGAWAMTTVQSSGGRLATAALAPDETITFTWYRVSSDNLELTDF